MSRVGKLPVVIPDNIKVAVSGSVISFDSGKVKKTYEVSKGVKVVFENKQIQLSAIDKKLKITEIYYVGTHEKAPY